MLVQDMSVKFNTDPAPGFAGLPPMTAKHWEIECNTYAFPPPHPKPPPGRLTIRLPLYEPQQSWRIKLDRQPLDQAGNSKGSQETYGYVLRLPYTK